MFLIPSHGDSLRAKQKQPKTRHERFGAYVIEIDRPISEKLFTLWYGERLLTVGHSQREAHQARAKHLREMTAIQTATERKAS